MDAVKHGRTSGRLCLAPFTPIAGRHYSQSDEMGILEALTNRRRVLRYRIVFGAGNIVGVHIQPYVPKIPGSDYIRLWASHEAKMIYNLGFPGNPCARPHDSTGEPGAGNRPAGFGERGEETCPWESACGPAAKAPDEPPTPYRLRASPRLYTVAAQTPSWGVSFQSTPPYGGRR